jgi:hypothetical protein
VCYGGRDWLAPQIVRVEYRRSLLDWVAVRRSRAGARGRVRRRQIGRRKRRLDTFLFCSLSH